MVKYENVTLVKKILLEKKKDLEIPTFRLLT